MKIEEIRKLLVGKHIRYYNGFNGHLDYFTIGYAEKKGDSIKVSPEKGKGIGIYIPNEFLQELVDTGKYKTMGNVEGCRLCEEWELRK